MGVIVSGFTDEATVQGNIFVENNNSKLKILSTVSDYLNMRFGRDTVKLGSQGSKKEWSLRQENLSKRYTTNWDELLIVKAK